MGCEAEDAGMLDTVGLHLGDDVGDVGMPVTHAYIDLLAEQFTEHLALEEGPAGEGWAFGEWLFAEADFGVAMLEFFDDLGGHGAATGDLLEILGHLAELVGGAVGEQENSGTLAGGFSTHFLAGLMKWGVGDAELFDPFDDLDNVVDGGTGNDAVAEVEDVTGAAVGEGEDFADAGLEDVEGGEEGDGVKVALDGAAGTGGAPALVEGDAPVETEDVGGGFGHGGEYGGGVDSKIDDGDAEGFDALDELGGGGEAVLAVVGDGERAYPGVKDLDAVGAGFYLLLRVGDEDGVELLHEEGPRAVVGVHHLLGFDVVAGASAFNHVAGEGKRSAAKADDAEAVAVGAGSVEVGGYFFYGLGYV